MISEELDLYSLVKESLERDIRNQEEKNTIFKSYLKKDRYDNFSLVNYGSKECSIHCIFNDTKLREYFSSIASVKSIAALNDCGIVLKKYRFDILIVEMSGVSLAYRVVAYIDEFEIDTFKKTHEEKIPKNVNLFNEINSNVIKIAQAYLKKIVNENNLPVFDARNFSMKKFPNAQANKISLFQSIKKFKKIQNDNILINTNTSLRNPMVLLDNVEIDYDTIEKVKKFDYTKSFCLNPTQVREKLGREFDISPSELFTNIEMEREKEILFKPSKVQINKEINEPNIREFLMKKVKRHRTSKTEKNLPIKIQSLIKSYGDICANISNETALKYQERNSIQII